MERREISTDKAPRPMAPYAQAVVAGNLVFVSGQIGVDPRTGKLVEGGVREQAKQALENLKAILEAAGCAMDDVVLVLVFLKDMRAYSVFNEVYSKFFSKLPARAVVGVSDIPAGAEVEVLAIAAKPPSHEQR